MRVMRAIGVWVVPLGLLWGCAGDPEVSEEPPVEALGLGWLQVLQDYDPNLPRLHPLAQDRDGNLTVSLKGQDGCFELRRFAGDGTELWRRPFADPPPAPARCPYEATLAADPDANLLALGYSYTGISPDFAVFVRKYDPQGEVIWTGYDSTRTYGN